MLGIFFVNISQNSPEGQRPSGEFFVTGRWARTHSSGTCQWQVPSPSAHTGATAIFAEGKNAYRARPPAPKIPNANAFGIFTYSLFTIHFSLNPTAYPGFLESNK